MHEWERVLPIRAKANEVFNFENREFYHVGRAVEAILANPHSFTFSVVAAKSIIPTLEGHGNIDYEHVASLSWEDAQRPLLFITYPDNTIRLVDGHHRAMRTIRDFGAEFLGAWILTVEETGRFMVSQAQAAKLPRV